MVYNQEQKSISQADLSDRFGGIDMIRSTFGGFTTAQLAMSASQRALDVVGQNIANINTEGYTRQRLDIASINFKNCGMYSNSPAKVGYGVEITGISQLRDPFLDAQYRTQIAKLGTTDALTAGYEQLATVFDETTKDGVKNALLNLSTSLTQLSEHVGEQEFDSMVRSNMQILLNLFHENATRLQDIRHDVEANLMGTDLSSVNDIIKGIAEINGTIKNSQILGNPVLELQDQRNNLLDELASYLPINVVVREAEVAPNQYIEVIDVNFIAADGSRYSLIADDKHGELEVSIDKDHASFTVVDSLGNSFDSMEDNLGDGTLKGTLDLLNKSGAFDTPPSEVKGLGYYEKSFNSLVKTFAETFNSLNETHDNIKRDLFTKIDPAADWSASNIKIADEWTNGEYGITASKKSIDGEIGSTANDNVIEMLNALDKSQTFVGGDDNITFFNGSFYDCFTNIGSTLAIDLKSSKTLLSNHISILQQISNSRDGVSGVQLDEEGINLMHYNQSYSAAARLMTTLDEALDTLINKTGVVGR